MLKKTPNGHQVVLHIVAARFPSMQFFKNKMNGDHQVSKPKRKEKPIWWLPRFQAKKKKKKKKLDPGL
jgi:hypothetical protein